MKGKGLSKGQTMLLITLMLMEVHVSSSMTSSSCPSFCECDVSRKYITCYENISTPSIFLFPNDTRQLEIKWQFWPVLDTRLFANLGHLRKLQLTSNAIEEIKNDFTKLQKLKRLDLRDNLLNDSVFTTIGQMKQLKELILDMNQLKLTNNSTFVNLEHVELLSLSWNLIEVIPSLRGLKEVQKLFLSNNFIRTLNRSTFSNLHKLEELYLEGNSLTQIEPGWANNLHFLRHLDLSDNFLGLQGTVDVIGFERQMLLETLLLSNNSLSHIPCLSISKSKFLVTINLSYNYLKNPGSDCLNKLKFLEILDLKGNQIEYIEDTAFQGSIMLRELFLDENFITSLPPFWLKGTPIHRINLSFNELVEISNTSFSGLENLSMLLLSENRISSISTNAFCSTRLTALDLNFNELQVINASQFTCAKELTILALGNNLIYEIDFTAFDGIVLTQLYLDFNRLESISENLIMNNNLDVLFLEENPWVCDCKLKWMRLYIDIGRNSSLINAFSSIVCVAPHPVAHFELEYAYYEADLMVCSDFPSSLTIKVILIVSISIIGLVVTFNIIKLYCRYLELQKYGGDSEEKTHAL